MSLLPLVVVLVLVGAVAVGAALTRHAPPTPETAVAAARRHARRTATAAVAAGALAALATAAPMGAGGLGIALLRAPVVFAITHTAVLALGEFTWPRPEGQLRRARLTHRGLLDAAPRRLLVPAAVSLVVAAVVVTVGGLVAHPDGRTLPWTTGVPLSPDVVTEAHSPFPGWFYGRPAALGMLALVVVALLALRVVATRPAVSTNDDRADAALRRASVHRVLRAVTAVLLVETGGLVLIAGLAVPDIAPGPVRVLGGAMVGIGAVGMLAGTVVACLRAPGVPACAPAVPVG